MNYNSIIEFGKKEGCYFFTICPEKICLREDGIERKCLMVEREIYRDLLFEDSELAEDSKGLLI